MCEPSNPLDEFAFLSPGLRDFIWKWSEEEKKYLVRATLLDRDSQHLADGAVRLDYPSTGKGMFFPKDVTGLDAHYPAAILQVAGMPDAVHIKDVQKDPVSEWIWEFLMT